MWAASITSCVFCDSFAEQVEAERAGLGDPEARSLPKKPRRAKSNTQAASGASSGLPDQDLLQVIMNQDKDRMRMVEAMEQRAEARAQQAQQHNQNMMLGCA